MLRRYMSKILIELASQYPVVTLTGPRQSGKTTLVMDCFRDKAYVNLESPQTRQQAVSDPISFLEQYPKGAILDEIQQVPELLSYIQVRVDENQQAGEFILTGSHQLLLHQSLSQSLAGRTAILKLLPLSIQELETNQYSLESNELIWRGFYPRIYKDQLDPAQAYENYIATYVERDVRQLINLKDLHTFQLFIKLCASRVGQVINFNSISNDLGVSHHTVKNWLSVLEASYLIILLQPYYENFGKRLIKSPKLYFTDVGLVTHLLDINQPQQVLRDPMRGQLFENMVLLDLIKHQLNRGIKPNFYFYRDSSQREIDIIYKQGSLLTPIEIKSSKTFHKHFLQQLDFFANLAGERCKKRYIIYAGDTFKQQNNTILNFQEATNLLDN